MHGVLEGPPECPTIPDAAYPALGFVPGKDGDLGVLPGHSQVMSSLRPGRVMVYSEDKNLVKSFFNVSKLSS